MIFCDIFNKPEVTGVAGSQKTFCRVARNADDATELWTRTRACACGPCLEMDPEKALGEGCMFAGITGAYNKANVTVIAGQGVHLRRQQERQTAEGFCKIVRVGDPLSGAMAADKKGFDPAFPFEIFRVANAPEVYDGGGGNGRGRSKLLKDGTTRVFKGWHTVKVEWLTRRGRSMLFDPTGEFTELLIGGTKKNPGSINITATPLKWSAAPREMPRRRGKAKKKAAPTFTLDAASKALLEGLLARS